MTLLIVLLLVSLGAAAVVVMMFVNPWIQAKASGIPMSIPTMLMMRLRRVDPAVVLQVAITLYKAGIQVEIADMEAHVLAGGNLPGVAEALISADKADLDMDFQRLAAIDLAGRDVVAAVSARVTPKVLLCPTASSGQAAITGVAQDGIRLAVRVRVTVRTQLDKLVGGAGDDTIVARVGEGIVAAIGHAASHRSILERPEAISAYLLDKGLDSGTCFEILSVDVADVDVLDNVAARLQSDQAEADKRIAQAQAEVRRTAAVAAHQEMKARTRDMESRVVAASAVEPLAVASSLAEANMGRRQPLPPSLHPRLRWKRGGA